MNRANLSKNNLLEFLDFDLLKQLIDRLYELTHIPITLLDTQGETIVQSKWSSLCSDFMHKTPCLRTECIEICSIPQNPRNHSGMSLTCPHGLNLYRIPIYAKSNIVAFMTVSQFFYEPPEIEYFKAISEKCHFKMDVFLHALKQIPVITQTESATLIRLVDSLAALLHNIIEKQVIKQQLEVEIQDSYEELEASYQELSLMNTHLDRLNREMQDKTHMLEIRENRYSTLFNTLHQGIILIEKETGQEITYNVIDINPYMEQLLASYNREIPASGIVQIPLIKDLLCKSTNGKITYFDSIKDRYYEIQSIGLNQTEIMLCITDVTATQKELDWHKQQMRDLVVTMSSLVEKRDLYTADHQKNVARLSTKMAIYMGLENTQIESIYIAAMLHDIGKISIPAEILTKPDKLTSIEYELMKTHVNSGYDILKNIHFTLPVAEIVKQHHERLDGSGYPDGLTGDEIRIEAQIIAVADVYEAITSHRPYRPSLGIEFAMAHLFEERGKFYAPEAVDACAAVAEDTSYDIETFLASL